MLARVIFGEIVQHTFWRIKYWRISHACIHIPLQEYYWWTKYWRFYSKIANRQSLLLTNISSYTVNGYILTVHFLASYDIRALSRQFIHRLLGLS